MLPVLSDLEDVKAQVEGLDGIVLSGGWDIDPLLYGEQPLLAAGLYNERGGPLLPGCDTGRR